MILRLIASSFAVALGAQTSVGLRSGNAAAGLPDPAISCLRGPSTSGFGVPFTANDFAAARSGPQAIVRPGLAGWLFQLPSDPLAQWVDTPGTSASALYAIPFSINPQATSAVLRLEFAVDDSLGESGIPGVYVNDQPLANAEQIGSYYYAEHYANGQVLPLLQPGTNWLYFYARNTGGAGGLLFSASLVLDGGMIQRFGPGCAGSAGTPIYLAAAASTAPGTPVSLRLYNLATAPAPVMFLFGLDARTCFGIPTPADLGFLGFPGCSGLFEVQSFTFGTNTAGAASLAIAMPPVRFVGVSLYTQAFAFDNATPRGASMSGAIELRAGN